MKRTKLLIFIISIILIISVAIILQINYSIEKRAISDMINNFLENIINNNYDYAFENVAYYDEASDKKPMVKYDVAKSYWIEKLKTLNSKQIKIESFNNVSVWKDDGYPKAKANVFILVGNVSSEYTIYFHLMKINNIWKIQTINTFPQIDEIEECISGKYSKD